MTVSVCYYRWRLFSLLWCSLCQWSRLAGLAGQFAKPRSAPTEVIDGIELPSYRGDMVNAMGFTDNERTPDPKRLLRVWRLPRNAQPAAGVCPESGLADLTKVHSWVVGFLALIRLRPPALRSCVAYPGESLNSCSLWRDFRNGAPAGGNRFYTSHEALLLTHEEALTRDTITDEQGWYATSAHMIWIGTGRASQMERMLFEYAHERHCQSDRVKNASLADP